MLRSVFCMIIVLALTACVPNFLVKKEYVEVPTPVSCVTWQPERKASEFNVLDDNSYVWAQVKALVTDREVDQDYIKGLESVVNGCKTE